MASKGIDVIVSVGGTAVACQKGATLNRSAEAVEYFCKNPVGGGAGWKNHNISVREWSIEAEGLYTIGDNGFQSLETAFVNGTPVTIDFVDTDAETGGSTGDIIGWTGQAVITEFPIEAPEDDMVTYNVTFMGSGELSQKKIA